MEIVELEKKIDKAVIVFEDGSEREIENAIIVFKEENGIEIQPIKADVITVADILTSVVMMGLEGALTHED